jgi:hypothetical protein
MKFYSSIISWSLCLSHNSTNYTQFFIHHLRWLPDAGEGRKESKIRRNGEGVYSILICLQACLFWQTIVLYSSLREVISHTSIPEPIQALVKNEYKQEVLRKTWTGT